MTRALVALLVGATVSCSSANLLDDLNKVNPKGIAGQTPGQIGQAVKKTAEGAVKTANSALSSAETSRQSGQRIGQDIAQQAKEAAGRLQQAGPDIESRAKNAGQRAADNMHSVVSKVTSEATKTAESVARSPKYAENIGHEAVQQGKKVADQVREAVPKVTDVASKTSHHVENVVNTATGHGHGGAGHDGAVQANSTEQVGDGKQLTEEGVEDSFGLSTQFAGFAFVSAAAVAGYFVAQRFKQSSTRSPILLSDALETVDADTQRGGLMQMSNLDETAFSRF